MRRDRPQLKTPPAIPANLEVLLAIIAAAIYFFVVVLKETIWWAYLSDILAMTLIYAFVWYLTSIITEKPRFVRMAILKRNDVIRQLGEIEKVLYGIRNTLVQENLSNALECVYQTIQSLDEQPYGKALTGFIETAAKVSWLWPRTLSEYLDIQNHPQKAGSKYVEFMRGVEEGIQGFAQWAVDYNIRANRGDISAASTHTMLLRSLRNLLGNEAKS